jgi:hypothetical protein
MKAANLNFSKLRSFSAAEWPCGIWNEKEEMISADSVLEEMDALIVLLLNRLRNSLPASYAIYPSPVPRAHVRYENGRGRHYLCRGKRRSDATDFFMSWAHVWLAWQEAQRILEIGGIGLYLDTEYDGRITPMLHIDAREKRLLWVSVVEKRKRIYVFHESEPVRFHQIIAKYGRVS